MCFRFQEGREGGDREGESGCEGVEAEQQDLKRERERGGLVEARNRLVLMEEEITTVGSKNHVQKIYKYFVLF